MVAVNAGRTDDGTETKTAPTYRDRTEEDGSRTSGSPGAGPTDRPAAFSTGVALCAALGAGIAAGRPVGAASALVGAIAIGGGCIAGRRRAVAVGAGLAFCGVVLAGLAGAGTGRLLIGVAAAVLAWDAGEGAITVGEQVGQEGLRAEVVHTLASAFVALGGTAGAYALFLIGGGGRPFAALAALLLAAIAIASALRLRPDGTSKPADH